MSPCKNSSSALNLDMCVMMDFQDELVIPVEHKAQGLAGDRGEAARILQSVLTSC